MTGPYVYPRLPSDAAQELAETLVRERTKVVWSTSHPAARPVETGTPVSRAVLEQVRTAAVTAVEEWNPEGPTRSQVASWDRAIGRALYTTMRIVPADASHEGPWSFLTLVLLPDLALLRFPDGHLSRLLGGQRNVFRRAWWRERTLGDLEVPDGRNPLGEDELVGLFERTRMARNRELTRVLAAQILLWDGPARMTFARDLVKRTCARTGPHLLDVLNRNELQEIVSREAKELAATS